MTLADLVRTPEPPASELERWPAVADRWDWAAEMPRLRANVRAAAQAERDAMDAEIRP